MLAELLSVSAVVGLSVAAVLCPCGSHGLCRAGLLLSAGVDWSLLLRSVMVVPMGTQADSSSGC